MSAPSGTPPLRLRRLIKETGEVQATDHHSPTDAKPEVVLIAGRVSGRLFPLFADRVLSVIPSSSAAEEEEEAEEETPKAGKVTKEKSGKRAIDSTVGDKEIVKSTEAPTQIGLLLNTAGVSGIAFISIVIVLDSVRQPVNGSIHIIDQLPAK